MEDLKVMRDPIFDPMPTCSSLYYIFVHVDCANGNTCWSGHIDGNCKTSQQAGGGWFCYTKYAARCPENMPSLNCALTP